MHIEFLDLLRCPNPHEETWLVAALHQMDGRLVIEAKLGCPVCGAEYFIRDGIAIFGGDESTDSAIQNSPQEEAAMRIAAFLDLTGPGKLVLLAGDEAAAAEALSELADARVVSLNASSQVQSVRSEGVAGIRAGPPIPLAAKSLHGVALDELHSTPALIGEAARLLRPRGRLLARARAELSPEFRELARDADRVIAEYVGELVSLRR
jgi:uncharacterized protein YbaR (Trm112 family)